METVKQPGLASLGSKDKSRRARSAGWRTTHYDYAVYISHARTERETVALPLHNLLQNLHISSFVDAGDSVPTPDTHPQLRSVLETAPIGIFILSPEFVAREWPMKELSCFLARIRDAKKTGRIAPVLIPVFYRLGVKCWKDQNLFNQRDEMGQNIFVRDGFFELGRARFFDHTATGEDSETGIRSALRELRRFRGVVNKKDANNLDTKKSNALRSEIIARISTTVEQTFNELDLSRREVADPFIVKAALKQGRDRLDTVRLMVLGGSTRGKSSTLASLRREAFDEHRDSTRGVDLSVYYLVLGTTYVGDSGKATLAEKDKFQTKFYSYVASNVWHDANDPVPIDATGPPGEPGFYSALMIEETEKLEQRDEGTSNEISFNEKENENVSESVIQLADDAMNSSEFHDTDMEGVTLRCWDFGGQREYEVAHEMFISPRSILMLVFDLERFEDESTQDEEVSKLCQWLQTLFAVTAEEDVFGTAASLLIVGTRRDSCKCPEKVPDYLELLKERLADVLDEGVTNSLDVRNVKILAIENSTAVEEPQTSGLHALEEQLDRVAKQIISQSKAVPLRWLAFLESLRTDNDDMHGIFVDPDEIKPRMNGFCFPLSEVDRMDELKALLLYFRDLGELVLFDKSRLELTAATRDFVVFMDPEKVLRALKVIVAPKRIRCEGLVGRRDRTRMRQGLLTKKMLKDKWEDLEGLTREKDREMLVELLTSMDLFVKLGQDLLGVPALLKRGWDDWGWISAGADKNEVAAVTTFENFVPFGLIGRLISRLHRSIGAEQTNVQYVRSNAVLLTIGLDDIDTTVTQVFMGFDTTRRELHWKVRGETYGFRMLCRCLTVFEAHMRERINAKMCNYEHFFVTDCPQGCTEMKFRLVFPIPPIGRSADESNDESNESGGELWWDVIDLDVDAVSRICKPALCKNANCHNVYSYVQAMKISEPSIKPGLIRKGIPDQYAAFVSHAGPDKDWAVYLAEALERKRLRTFVDRLELKCSSETGDDLMKKAMQTARVGVFILSPEFVGRKWTMRELRTFLSRNTTNDPEEKVVIYPIFHRLSYKEAAESALDRDPKYRSVLEQNGFFKENRQNECSTHEAHAAMQKLSKYPGLEKKLQELHKMSMQRSQVQYRVTQVCRMIRNTVITLFGYDNPDEDLGGVTLEAFFDFAAERVASEYHTTHQTEAS